MITLGPWTYFGSMTRTGDRNPPGFWSETAHKVVCHFDEYGGRGEPKPEDRVLMLTSPELLESLAALTKSLEHDENMAVTGIFGDETHINLAKARALVRRITAL